MKKRIFLIATVGLLLGLMTNCTTNKKKKCDTCPKWTSEALVSDKILRA